MENSTFRRVCHFIRLPHVGVITNHLGNFPGKVARKVGERNAKTKERPRMRYDTSNALNNRYRTNERHKYVYTYAADVFQLYALAVKAMVSITSCTCFYHKSYTAHDIRCREHTWNIFSASNRTGRHEVYRKTYPPTRRRCTTSDI